MTHRRIYGSANRLTIDSVCPITPIADSFDDWSVDGEQGENNWFNGY